MLWDYGNRAISVIAYSECRVFQRRAYPDFTRIIWRHSVFRGGLANRVTKAGFFQQNILK